MRWTGTPSTGWTATPRSSAVAELMLYGGGLGVVLRCPGCGAVMIRLARTPAGHHLDMRGVALLRIAATGPSRL